MTLPHTLQTLLLHGMIFEYLAPSDSLQSFQPGGVVLPASATVYGQLVQCPILAAQSSGVQPRQQQQQQQDRCRPPAHALHVDPLYPGHLKLLSEPFQIFTFDFANPPERGRVQQIQASQRTALHCTALHCTV